MEWRSDARSILCLKGRVSQKNWIIWNSQVADIRVTLNTVMLGALIHLAQCLVLLDYIKYHCAYKIRMDTKVQGWAPLLGTLPWSMWTVYTWPELGDGESIMGYMCSATFLFMLSPYKPYFLSDPHDLFAPWELGSFSK